jgi:hypothetical protein
MLQKLVFTGELVGRYRTIKLHINICSESSFLYNFIVLGHHILEPRTVFCDRILLITLLKSIEESVFG